VPSADKRQRKKENARQARAAREAAAKRSQRMKTGRNVGIVVVLVVIVIVLINVFSSNNSNKKSSTSTTTTPTTAAEPTTTTAPARNVKLTGFVADPTKSYSATIKTNYGDIVVSLDAKDAPKAAGRFIELSRLHFYDGTTWTRVVKDFVIQGGDPTGTGSGGSGNKAIVGEVPKDHYPVGSLAAAKSQTDPNGSFDSQFFIVTGSQGGSLPNQYARFGLVTSGLNVAQQIGALYPPTNNNDGAPTKPAKIDSITITES
jgi:cyclophilin family peptidyl-prolyl cis-trans isomerase